MDIAEAMRDRIDALEERQSTHSDALIIAFVQGVQWWEFRKTGATLWGSDREFAEQEAIKRLKENKLGKFREGDQNDSFPGFPGAFYLSTSPHASKMSEGARLERKTFRERLRRGIKLYSDSPETQTALKQELEWVLTRSKRYDAKEGGLGKK